MPVRGINQHRIGFVLVSLALAASCGGESGPQETVTPSEPQAAAVQLSPSTVNMIVGTDYQLTAVVVNGAGAIIRGQTISWNSLNAPIASVTQAGNVHGVSVGIALVTAVFGSHVSVDTINVRAAP